MPVFFENCTNDFDLFIWKIEENIDELFTYTNLLSEEIKTLNSFRNQQRKLQYLATRAILKKYFPLDLHISYNKNGKPYLNNKLNISISHSKNYAAIIVSKYKVAIDVEIPDNKIFRITQRMLSSEEQSYIDINDVNSLYLCWGAKESMVKITNNKNYIYNKDLSVNAFKIAQMGTFTGNIKDNTQIKNLSFNYKIFQNLVLVWSIDK